MNTAFANHMAKKRLALAALYAEWKKLSPNLVGPDESMTERDLRIWYANQKLHGRRLNRGIPDVKSWNDLKPNEARYLLRCMREESGDGPAYRAQLIARLAMELFGAARDRKLGDRLRARFRKFKAIDLTPAEAHSEIEELISRIARMRGSDVESVRRRFSGGSKL